MRKKLLKIGVFALVLGIVGLVAFHYGIAVPYYWDKLSNHTYGELFGPVSFFLWPIYSCSAIVIVFGLLMVVVSVIWKG